MSNYDPTQSHDQNIKTAILENPLAAITFAIPKCINFFRHAPEIIAIHQETIKTFFAESFKYLDFLAYYFNLGEKEWKAYHAYKQGKKEEKEFEMITNILREQAREEGKLKEDQTLLLSLLPKRFGPMPADVETAARTCTEPERLHSILVRFLELRDWHEVRQLLQGE